MSENQIPLPPRDIGHCEQCRHWLARHKKQIVLLPNGQKAPMEALSNADRLNPAIVKAPKSIEAFCTYLPSWIATADKWWCGQWRPLES